MLRVEFSDASKQKRWKDKFLRSSRSARSFSQSSFISWSMESSQLISFSHVRLINRRPLKVTGRKKERGSKILFTWERRSRFDSTEVRSKSANLRVSFSG